MSLFVLVCPWRVRVSARWPGWIANALSLLLLSVAIEERTLLPKSASQARRLLAPPLGEV